MRRRATGSIERVVEEHRGLPEAAAEDREPSGSVDADAEQAELGVGTADDDWGAHS